MYILVALAICIVLLTLETSRNKRKIMDLKMEFDLKNKVMTQEKIKNEVLTLEQVRQFMKDNLLLYADIEEVYVGHDSPKRLVISLSLGKEILSETKLIIP